MDYTSDGDADLEAYGAETYRLLLSGDIKVMNDEGFYQCPFCSYGMGNYNVRDLVQHALVVGNAHDRQVKEKIDHRALVKHLKDQSAKSPSQMLQSMLKDPQPPQHNRDELFVWPWMCVVANMPSEFVGKSANRLKEHFSCFHPVKVYHVYSKGNPTGNAIVEFGKDLSALRNARVFESQFETKGCGKKGWKEKGHGGPESFGWIAREDDYNSPGAIGDHLRKNGDLKTANGVQDDETVRYGKLVASLSSEVLEKDMHLQALECEYEERTAFLDRMMGQKEQEFLSYNQEIQKMQHLSVVHTQKVVDENKKLQKDLQSMMRDLDNSSKQLDELTARTDEDRRNLEIMKKENAMKSNHLMLATLEEQKAEEKLLKLVEQHTKEKEAALENIKKLSKQWDERHELQLEINYLMRKLQVMKLTPGDEDSESGKRIAELTEELADKISDMECAESLNQDLITMEKKAVVELQEARKMMIDVLPGMTRDGAQIGIRRIGELNLKAFSNVCRQKFPEDDAGFQSVILCSKWQKEIENPEWHPFTVAVINGKESEVISEDDKKLQELKDECGEEAYAAVTKALIELNEHSGCSGRVLPFLELWNHKEGRKAKTWEAIQDVIELFRESKSRRRRAAQHMAPSFYP